MWKGWKRTVAGAVCGCMVVLCGCSSAGDLQTGQNSIPDSIAEVWGCASTFKVLQDVDNFEDVRQDAKIEMNVAKGEYEAHQIIISAKKDVEYEFEVASLTSSSGEVFAEEQIEVFHEKYIEIVSNYNGDITGIYPDAIVPLENIIERGENKVSAGDNQGIYIRFNIPKEQKAGIYEGTFVLKVAGKEQNIPVVLNVMNVEVPEENNMKSIFIVNYGSWVGEQDGSQDMLNKYTEFLYDYRISSANIMLDNQGTDEDVEYYTDLAYEYMQNPKCSFVMIPYNSTGFTVTKDFSQKYLYAFARKSLETGYNMFHKTGTYIGSIDEPDSFGVADEAVEATSRDWTALCVEVAEAIAADTSLTSPIKDEVVESIRNCYNVVTTAEVERYAPLGVTTFCPKFYHYDTERQRAVWEQQTEKWWYGCTDPKAPYPNYEIDHQSLTGIRSMGWMAANYDIIGNLFWSADLYSKAGGMGFTSSNKPLEDYYDTAERFPKANGDGFLVYPGAAYDIDGPVATLRLEALRDGLEEYELLRKLKSSYEVKGSSMGEEYQFDSTSLFSFLSGFVYDGTKVTADTDSFLSARDALLRLCELHASDTEFYFVDYKDNNTGTKSLSFVVKEGTVIEDAGKEAADKKTVSGDVIYTFTSDMQSKNNILDLTVASGNDTFSFKLPLGGKYIYKAADVLTGKDITSDAGMQYDIVSSIPGSDEQGTFGRLHMGSVAEGEEQTVHLSGDFISAMNTEGDKACLNIYCNTQAAGTDETAGVDDGKTVSIIVSAKFKNNQVLIDLTTEAKLVSGMNKVEFSLSSVNWSKLGEIEYLQLKFGELGESARTIYLGGLSVYAK